MRLSRKCSEVLSESQREVGFQQTTLLLSGATFSRLLVKQKPRGVLAFGAAERWLFLSTHITQLVSKRPAKCSHQDAVRYDMRTP